MEKPLRIENEGWNKDKTRQSEKLTRRHLTNNKLTS
jgi:hypothetical protein